MLIPTLVRHDYAVPSTRRSGAEDLWCSRLNLAWLRYSKSRQRGNKISETGSKSSVEDRDTEIPKEEKPTGMPPLPCQQRLSDISTDTEGTEGIRGSREPKNKGHSFSTAQPAYADPGRQWSTRPEVYCRLGLSRAGAYARGGSFRKGEGGRRRLEKTFCNPLSRYPGQGLFICRASKTNRGAMQLFVTIDGYTDRIQGFVIYQSLTHYLGQAAPSLSLPPRAKSGHGKRKRKWHCGTGAVQCGGHFQLR